MGDGKLATTMPHCDDKIDEVEFGAEDAMQNAIKYILIKW